MALRNGLLKNKRGSSSALIVMLVVLLIFFGVLALVSAASNIRLSEKRAVWNATYYFADYEAERVLSSIDRIRLPGAFSMTLTDDQLETIIQEELQQHPTIIEHEITVESSNVTVEALVAARPGETSGMSIKLAFRLPAEYPEAGVRILRWSWWSPPFNYAGYEASFMEEPDQ